MTRIDVAGNQLESMSDLKYLNSVTYLCASDNNISDINDLVTCLCELKHLRELDLQRNPIMNKPRIRDAIIISSQSLGRYTKQFSHYSIL